MVNSVEVNSVLTELPSETINFEQSVFDFDVTVFDSVVDVPGIGSKSSSGSSSNVLPFASKSDSLIARVSYIEGLLGIHQLAVCGFHSEGSVGILAALCQNTFEWDVTEQGFVIIHWLDCGRAGLLVRVSSLDLKERLLGEAYTFECLGFGVGLH